MISRRAALRGGLAAGGALAVPAGAWAALAQGDDGSTVDLTPPDGWDYPAVVELLPFGHGVASGDPLADRVILWTRITVPDARGWDVADPQGLTAIAVDWVIARDPELTDVARRGRVVTTRAVDWTVKVDADGLDSATTYWYAFAALDRTSPVGRTRTAPAPGDDVTEVRIAHVACTSYWSTAFNAYARIADRDDVDVLLHAGDHVYEFVDDFQWYRGRNDILDDTYVDFRAWHTADECRRRYALYASEPDCLRAHQSLPWAIIVDNHDVDDHEENGVVTFTADQASEVFWEWTPSRPPVPDRSGRTPASPGPDAMVPVPRGEGAGFRYRSLPYGDLADLLLIDMRSFRTPSRATLIGPPTDADPNETILGPEQESWFHDELLASKQRGTVFRVIDNGVNMSQLRAFNVPLAATFADLGFNTTSIGVIYPNGWDEWPEARRRLFEWLRSEGIVDNVVLSGDAHGWFASDLVEDNMLPNYEPLTGGGLLGAVGVELQPGGGGRKNGQGTVAGAIWGAAMGGPAFGRYREFMNGWYDLGLAPTIALEAAARLLNPNLHHFNWRTWGYGLVHLTREAATLELWEVPAPDPSPHQGLAAAFRSPVGAPHLFPVLAPQASRGSRVAARPPAVTAVADRATFGLDAVALPVAPTPGPGALPATGSTTGHLVPAAAAVAAALALRRRASHLDSSDRD